MSEHRTTGSPRRPTRPPTTVTVALLHPGRMGTTLGQDLVRGGHRVLWLSPGRSDASRERAERSGFTEVRDAEALREADVVISICEPSASLEVARTVARGGFHGVYLDANAGSPERIRAIAGLMSGEVRVVDGCVIGNPAPEVPGPRLYLAGDERDTALLDGLFRGGPVTTRRVPGGLGAAKALKTAYAAHQKTGYVLALLSLAYAHEHGVHQALLDAAAASPRPLVELGEQPGRAASVTARAWRWAPELAQCADSFDAAGVPADLASAASAVLARWGDTKDGFDDDWARVLATVLAPARNPERETS